MLIACIYLDLPSRVTTTLYPLCSIHGDALNIRTHVVTYLQIASSSAIYNISILKYVIHQTNIGKYSSSDDYLRNDDSDYNTWLITPDQSTSICIPFVEGKGPLIAMVVNTILAIKMIILPYLDNHIISQRQTKAVKYIMLLLKTNKINPMKTHTYSNIIRIHKKQRLFQGICNYDVIIIESYSFPSILFDESELRSLFTCMILMYYLQDFDSRFSKCEIRIQKRASSKSLIFQPYYDRSIHVLQKIQYCHKKKLILNNLSKQVGT